MAEKWGEFEVEGHIDGRALPRETEQITTAAAQRGGKNFSQKFSRFMDAAAKQGARRFGTVFAKETDKASKGADRLSRSLDRGSTSVRRFLSNWKRMPHGFRQAVFWIGLVVSALGTLSVASSAVGGTIAALSTMLVGLGAAAGIAAVGFSGLFGEEEKLSKGAREAQTAFERLGAAFHDLQTGITNAMFDNMADSIEGLTNNLLPALEDSLNDFAGTVGDSIGRIFEALASEGAINNFNALLQGLRPIIDSLTTAIITFGDALGDILVASLPTAQAFAQAIADVGTRFSEWTSSEAGRERLALFFDTAERIMPKLVELVANLGQALAQLVTPTTLAGTESFLDALNRFVPVLGEIIEVIANINIFGILAEALNLIGSILTPLMPALQELGRILGEQLVAGLQELGPSFLRLGEALAPVIGFIAILIEQALPVMVDLIAGAIDQVSAFIEIFVAMGESLDEAGVDTKVFGEVVGTVFKTLGLIMGVWQSIMTIAFQTVAGLIRGDLSGAFRAFKDLVKKVTESIGLDFDKVWSGLRILKSNVGSGLKSIERFFRDFGRNLENIFSGIGDAINEVIGFFGNLFGAASRASNIRPSGGGGMAAGGILAGPRRILAGEAGPEAIVPLRRPLNRVDPSVRALSAFAQGLPMASGGVVGSGRVVNIESGAVQVVGSIDPERTSMAVLNRLAERIAG